MPSALRLLSGLTGITIILLLTACGGGGSSAPTSPPDRTEAVVADDAMIAVSDENDTLQIAGFNPGGLDMAGNSLSVQLRDADLQAEKNSVHTSVRVRAIAANASNLAIDWSSLPGTVEISEGDFGHLNSKTRVRTNMMFYNGPLAHEETSHYEAISVPINNNGLELLLLYVTPDLGIDTLTRLISTQWLTDLMRDLVDTSGFVAIPLMSISSIESPPDILSSLGYLLGAQAIANRNGDFFSINNAGFLALKDMQSAVSVEFSAEQLNGGSEAVAIYDATDTEPDSFTGGGPSNAGAIFTGHIDSDFSGCFTSPPDSRPFLYFIYDRTLQAPLMYGHVEHVDNGEIIEPDGENSFDEQTGGVICTPTAAP